MHNKLQELTDKLYNEGLAKGKEEGARILEDARKKADEMIAEARKEAEAIREAAERDAADLRGKTESDLRMASAQCLQATKSDIENLVIGKISEEKVNAALADKDFIKEIISAAAKGFSATEGTDMALMLPASLQADLEPWVKGELAGVLGADIKADFSKKVAGGFSIGPKNGSWFVSMTDATFRELIAEYIRPVTRKLLFG